MSKIIDAGMFPPKVASTQDTASRKETSTDSNVATKRARLTKFFINAYFLYVSLGTLLVGILITRTSKAWTISDWLINYEGGFVRRGLPGQGLLLLSRLVHCNPAFLVPVVYLTLYGVMLWSVRDLVLHSSRNIWVLALLISPATLSMQLLSPQAGYRKELILLSVLALFLALSRVRQLPSSLLVPLLTIFVIAAVLSHESLIFFLPYLFAALVVSGRDYKQACAEFALPAIAGASAAYLCSQHLGGTAAALQICHSLGYSFPAPRYLDICGSGAIPYMTRNAAFARLETLHAVRADHFLKLKLLPFAAGVGLLPCVGENRYLLRLCKRTKLYAVWGAALLASVASVVLFSYALDWGRWLHIHLMCVSLLLIAIDTLEKGTEGEPAVPAMQHREALPNVKVRLAFLAVYALTWALPNDIGIRPVLGYTGRVIELIQKRKPHVPTNAVLTLLEHAEGEFTSSKGAFSS